MNKSVPFAAVVELLRGLGFSEHAVSGSHFRFDHAPSGTILVMRAYRSSDAMSWHDLAVVRRFLLDKGLIEEAALDRALHDTAA
jgi:predicted RNA binding protein YcfA (HicA-like mRNA interferase family)